MSKQIQFRRGTSTEHETFTGAIGEITVDTTNKTLRVHDGETAGGTILAKQSEIPDLTGADYVVESQLPTSSNNYTWYRKYKSGWVEMGGKASVNGTTSTTITLPLEMQDTSYCVYTQALLTGSTLWDRITTQTTTSFTIEGDFSNPDFRPTHNSFWTVKGVVAQ